MTVFHPKLPRSFRPIPAVSLMAVFGPPPALARGETLASGAYIRVVWSVFPRGEVSFWKVRATVIEVPELLPDQASAL